MKKKINYAEGDCFSVPLRNGGFAVGVVARMDGGGGIFGYFFGPRFADVKQINVLDLSPEDNILIGMCGDLGLIKNEWVVVGRIPNWSRQQWAMPKFIRGDKDDLKLILSTYDENSLDLISEIEVEASEISFLDYPPDRLMGYGAVEIRLTKLLSDLAIT